MTCRGVDPPGFSHAGSRSSWVALCCALSSVAAASAAVAQQTGRVEVEIASDVPAHALRRALASALGANVVERELLSDAAPDCEPREGDAGAAAHVAIRWRRGQLASVCLAARSRAVQRELGPFAQLDASAREQLVTVVEAVLDALLRPAPESPAALAPKSTAPEAPATPRSALAVSRTPPPRAPTPLRVSHVENGHSGSLWSLGVAYKPTFWAPKTVAQSLGAYAARALGENLHLALHLVIVPGLSLEREGVDMMATAVQADAMLWASRELGPRFGFDAGLGAGVERLAVSARLSPSAQGGFLAEDKARLYPLFTAQIGPRMALMRGFWLTAQLGGSIASTRLQFHFKRDLQSEESVSLLRLERTRLFFELGARLVL
jgi:hypothetical protein